jgi:hypothetical protein
MDLRASLSVIPGKVTKTLPRSASKRNSPGRRRAPNSRPVFFSLGEKWGIVLSKLYEWPRPSAEGFSHSRFDSGRLATTIHVELLE